MSKQTGESILVVMDSYYPDSRATTHIMCRLLETMTDRFKIYVVCLNLLGHSRGEQPAEHNGVFIEYVTPLKREASIRYCFLKLRAKLAKRKCLRRYGTKYYYETLYAYAQQIKKLVKKTRAKKIISVATPTDIHICAEMVASSFRGMEWFPVSFDPHAYNYGYSEEMRKKFRHEEEVLYQRAKRVFFLKQSEKDYENSAFKDKITYFDLPLFFADGKENVKTAPKEQVPKTPMKLVYTGSIYRTIRNPEYMLEVLSRLSDVDFKLYVIGSFYGWNEDTGSFLKEWKEKYGEKIAFLDRVSREEVAEYLSQADVLLNIGNTTENQCPSKVLDYIASGKPILHFRKIGPCSSMRYLEKYPNVCIVDEREEIEKSASEIRRFLKQAPGRRIGVERLCELYAECRIEYIANLFLKYLNGN